MILIFLVKWATPVLVSIDPYDFYIVVLVSPKWLYFNAGVKLTVFPLIDVIVTFSNSVGAINEGAIPISSPTFHP